MKAQEQIFAELLEGLMKRAKAQNNVISEEQVRTAFAQLKLTDDQLGLVHDYLKKHRIGIGEPVDPDEYLTESDLDYLEMYLEDLGGLPKVSEAEKRRTFVDAMTGEPEAKQRLVEICLPQVVEVAKLYAGQGVFMEDLIGEGNVALTLGAEMLESLETAEEAEGFLIRLVMDAMETFIRDTGLAEGGEREFVERAWQLYQQAKELSESLLRKVTVEELARETEMEEMEIRDILQAMGGSMDYIEEGAENGNQ